MDLLELPIVMIEHIFTYLSYDEIAKNRLVNRTFNMISMRLLNRGFMMIERRHAMALKSVKAQLPRRESERRGVKRRRGVVDQQVIRLLVPRIPEMFNDIRIGMAVSKMLGQIDANGYHHLSRHCDILTSIETRISMLNMTYSKFIDNGLCCFIPGKVIDEIRRVLAIVETSTTPPRAHEVLQELRDISSMAIEHFDDKISPAFRKRMQQGAVPPAPRPANAILAPMAMRTEILTLRKRSMLNAKLSVYLARQYKKFYKRMLQYKNVANHQSKVIRDLNRKQKEQDNAIGDLKKRIEECDIKYSELTHTNQAVGGKAIAATAAGEASTSGQPLRHFSSQINLDLSVLPIGTSKRNNKQLSNMKPRKPVIKLPSLAEGECEPPAKVAKLEERRPPPSSPRTRLQSSLAKVKGITNEIKQLTKMSKDLDKGQGSILTKNDIRLKRAITLHVIESVQAKKQKID